MKSMKPEELRKMPLPELRKQLDEQKTALYQHRVQTVLMQTKDTDAHRVMRKNIARMMTILHEREITQS